ncbi:alpha/beta hydrolase [Deinococcus radiomollis]|uniref:alpha/beta fold hydrolase n=1 Tax=Deinococcus radiomollis TaxID=468916 RepID=UPI00389237F4
MTAPQHMYTSGSRRLYYRQSGLSAGHAEPLILIHGLSGSRRWWRYNLPALEAVRCVYVVELVGFGSVRRRQRSLSVQDAAALVAEWIGALDLKGVTVIGHSMGGQISLRVAALCPERVSGLVLAAASGLLHRAWWQVAAQLPLAMRRGRLKFVPTILADGARAGLPNLIRSSRDLLRDDVTDILPGIVQPTLVIWGENDVLLPPALGEAIAAGIRGSRFVLLPHAGHVLMVDSPLEFNREVLAFLATLEAEPPATGEVS